MPKDTIAWWRGEFNADDSVGGNHGSLMGATDFLPGWVGNFFSFDGDGDFVFVSNSASLNPKAITVDAWVRVVGTVSSSRGLVSKANLDGNPDNDSYSLFLDPGGVLRWTVFTANEPLGVEISATTSVADGAWHHVAATYDGSSVMRLYLDGVEVETGNATGDLQESATPVYLGALITAGQNGGYLDGALDEVEIIGRELSAAEIAALFQAGTEGKCECTEPPADMVAWWPGEGTLADIQGDNHGFLVGSITFPEGLVNRAFSFDGSGYVSIGNDPDLRFTGNAVSVDAWIFPTLDGQTGIIAGKTASSFNDYVMLLNGGNLLVGVKTDSVETFVGSATPVALNTWSHVAMTYDGASVTAYINGQVVATAAADGPLEGTNSEVAIGGRGDNANFVGLIDEVEIFNRGLSATEIAAIYKAGSAGKCRPCTPPPPDMLSWWPGDGNADDIQGPNDGTLESGASFAVGHVGGAFRFDGNDDYVDLGDINLPATFTIDAWINPILPAFYAAVVSDWEGNTDGSYELAVDQNGALWGSVKNENGPVTVYKTADGTIQPGIFQHVAMTYDGSASAGQRIQLYVDGVSRPVSLVADAGGTPATTGPTAKIGAAGDLEFPFQGLVDEVEFFTRVLTESEIVALYFAGSGGKCRAPIVPIRRQLANISTRAFVGTGDNVAIGGLIIRDESTMSRTRTLPGTKSVLIRGLGGSLPVTGALDDPFLQIFDSSGMEIASNDNWQDSQEAGIQATGLAPTNPMEAAILLELPTDSSYTAVLSGKQGMTGIGLIEIYDLEIESFDHLLNLSSRGYVSTGDNVLIGGLIVRGNDPSTWWCGPSGRRWPTPG